ncbi:MAG: hypothetical protein ACKOOH_10280 [Cyanobium sp.]
MASLDLTAKKPGPITAVDASVAAPMARPRRHLDWRRNGTPATALPEP